MQRHSAALLLYRRRGRSIEVLLVHPGGPFWAKKDEGAWSIPKGEYAEGEDGLAAARREFAEETGADPGVAAKGEPIALGSFRQSSAKIVDVWAAEGDFDPAQLASNTFEMEWPPRSGRRQGFPEADRAAWFAPADAERKIVKGQRPVLAALLEQLANGKSSAKSAAARQPVRRSTRQSASRRPAPPGTSAVYALFRRAILEEKQVLCTYRGVYRELCPHIVGFSKGKEKVLAFQFGGETGKGQLPPGGQWKCLFLAHASGVRLRTGPWYAGESHKSEQRCVTAIDLDVNVHVRKPWRPE